MRIRISLAIVVAIGVGATTGAQTSPSQPPALKGTAVLRGHVIDAEDGHPLRRALVRAVDSSVRANGVATTDEQGVYEIRDLPAGRYIVTANKDEYVGVAYGQLRPFDAGKPIDILDGQTVSKIDVTLSRGGVIAGRVIDEYGDAMPNVQVSAIRSQFVQGRRRLVAGGRAVTTDDLGEYRLFGLGPGDYYVSAAYRPAPAVAVNDDAPAYAVSYAPGTTSTADAQRISVGIGQSTESVNVAFVPVTAFQVTGMVVDSKGQPMAGGSVSLFSPEDMIGSGVPMRPDGTFILGNVAPGEYTLRVLGPSKENEQPDSASMSLTVSGQDITGIRIAAIGPSTAAGIVLLDRAAAASVKASSILWTVRSNQPSTGGANAIGSLRDDFTFEASGALQPGINVVGLANLPVGYALKAVRVAGIDVTDTGFEVKPHENVNGIEIELTSHPTSLSGHVTDSRGTSAKNAMVVAFARDERKWEGSARYVQTGKLDQDGKFTIGGLPPGEYYIAAASAMERSDDATDPDFLRQIRAQATSVSLSEGGSKVIELRVTGS